jgi:hypothetical protein
MKHNVYLKKTKMSFFFFLYKIGEQEGGTGPIWGRGRISTHGKGGGCGERV